MNAILHRQTSSSGRSAPSIQNIDNLRGCTIDTIIEAMLADEPTIVNAPPGSGKTHAVSRLARVLDFPITYLTEREDLYEDMADLCEEMGLQYKILPSPYRECSSFDPDSPDYSKVKDLYARGVLGKKLHEALDLGCDPGCPYVESLDFEPEEFDVLIGHYIHGYAKRYTGERVVVFDEFAGDGFVHEIQNADRKVTAFLKRARGLDYDSWSDLIADRGIKTNEEIYWWKKFRDIEVYDRTIIEDDQGEISKLSKDLAMGIAFAEDLGNGWETTNSDTTPTQDWLTQNIEVARSTENDVTTAWMIDTPDLSEAESIVALDGTPVLDMWETATGLEWDETRVVPDTIAEKQNVFHEIGGKEILVAGSGSKPYHTKDASRRSRDLDGAITMGAWLSQDQKPGVITTARTITDYERNRDALEYAREAMNYGGMLSSNEFKEFETGVVLGTPHPGDYDLKKWGALMGESVEGESRNYQAREYGETQYLTKLSS